jgi:glycosyltransferase involved in cell wall biosynthesis
MSGKIRVAIFSPEYPPHVFGGLGTHVGCLTSVLAESVFFELFAPEQNDYRMLSSNVNIHGVVVPPVRTSTEYWLQFCFEATRLAEKLESVDLIHCHDWMTISAGIYLRNVLKVPLIYNIHLPQVSIPTLLLENHGLVNSDLVIVNSQAVYQELNNRNLPVKKMEAIPNGVDIAEFHSRPNGSFNEDYLLFVGRLVPQKGVEVLLKAFGIVLRRCPEMRLIIVGDGDLELYLKRVSCCLGFPQRVSFIGWQTGQALVDLYQRALLVVMSSYYEPFGIVALEAMACGCPVIASRLGGLQEIIQDGVQGYLTPSGDYMRIAQRVVDLILHPDHRRRMSKAATERAAQFSWKRIGETVLSMYERTLENSVNTQKMGNDNFREEILKSLDPTLQNIGRGLFQ